MAQVTHQAPPQDRSAGCHAAVFHLEAGADVIGVDLIKSVWQIDSH
jgi:hypothetical protein